MLAKSDNQNLETNKKKRHTSHELIIMAVNLCKNELPVPPCTILELALQKAAAVLVLAQRGDLADELLDFGVDEACF